VNIDRPDGQTCPQPDSSSASEPINLGMERNLTLCVRPTRHLPDNIRLIVFRVSPVQEYARHVGHLDIVSELADGQLGE
jgi:hypothetical protein